MQVEGALPAAVLPYVPELLLELLARQEQGRPVQIDAIEGTLLFADVSGFTALSERLAQRGKEGAEILTSVINAYFEEMLAIARASGGDNLKFGGDALLLLFRGPGHASRATRVALDMMRATARFRAIRFGREYVKLSMSAGVHTGQFWSVLAGVPGRRMQQCILGNDAAHLARAEGHATKGEVMVSRATWALIESGFAGEPSGEFVHVLRAKQPPAGDWAAVPALPIPAAVLPYLPPPVVEGEIAGAARQEGEHRKVTTVFISVRGANEMLAADAPEATLRELNAYLEAVVELLERHGGYLVSNDIDSHGLKLIIIFGAPVGREQPTADAFRFALEFARERVARHLRLETRIGINSGFVFCGDLGSSFRRDYTVLGDAVNLAARLMAAASDQVLVSEATFREGRAGFVAEELPPIRVKGKAAPVAIRALTGEASAPGAGSERPTPFVGRDAELTALELAAAEAKSRIAQCVLVMGEPGTGKTRLVAEAESRLRARGWQSVRTACHHHTATAPYEPWVPVLERLFGLRPGMTSRERTRTVQRHLDAIDPGLKAVGATLNALLRVELPQSAVLGSLTDQGRRDRLHGLIAALLAHAAAEAPLAVVLEDIQWADEASLALLDAAFQQLRRDAVFFLLTARPMPGGDQPAPPETQRIVLGELPPAAARELLDQLLGAGVLPPGAMEDLLEKCRGNPLFLEEIATALRESGASSVDVPDRVQTLLVSRIDLLPPAARRALRLAAVVGATFDGPVLAALAADGDRGLNVSLALDLLERAGLVHPEPGTATTYRFRHNLLQEVAYEGLLFARRRELHQRTGEIIERLNAGHPDAACETLTHHFEHSGDTAKTLTYGVIAGDKARRVFAGASAVAYYRRALGAARRLDEGRALARSLVEERIGDALEVVGRHAEAAAAHRRALRAWREGSCRPAVSTLPPALGLSRRDAASREASLRAKIAVALERSSDYSGSLRSLDEALRHLPHRYPALEARIRGARSVAFARRGENERALAEAQAALAAARRSGRTTELAYAHQVVANAYYEVGQFRPSVRHRTASLRLYESAGDLSRILAAHGNLGLSYQEIGQIDRAIEHHEACLATARQLENTAAVAIASNNLGEAFLIQGRLAQARERFALTVETYRRVGDPLAPAGLALVNLCRVHLLEGELEAAQAALDEGLAMLRTVGARGLLLQGRAQRAELLFEQGDLEGAARQANRALGEARELGAENLAVRALRVLGRVAGTRGETADAAALLESAAATAARLGAEYELALSLVELARVRVDDAPGEAGRLRQRAARIFRRLGGGDQTNSARRRHEIVTDSPRNDTESSYPALTT